VHSVALLYQLSSREVESAFDILLALHKSCVFGVAELTPRLSRSSLSSSHLATPAPPRHIP